ncbi:MAG: V-type ATP synthase subunit E family protein [Candidatus Aminicenantes bacterium]|nr:V-type ATP synthase subunit E family protein [Candidatus Aminicenantes bacterium]
MSLDNILTKIIQEAEEEASRLRHQARQRAEELLAASQEEARKKAAEIISRAEQEAQTEALSLISQARLEKRLALLAIKRKWVDLILNKAFEEAGLLSPSLQKEVVTRQGIEQEQVEVEKLKEELRFRLEKLILKLLEI